MANLSVDKSKGSFFKKVFGTSSTQAEKTPAISSEEDDRLTQKSGLDEVDNTAPSEVSLTNEDHGQNEDLNVIFDANAVARAEAQKEYNIKTSKEDILRLEKRLIHAQNNTKAVLEALSLAEKAYKEAKIQTEYVVAEEKAAWEQVQCQTDHIRSINDTALVEAKDKIAQLAAELGTKREVYAAARAEHEKAQIDFKEKETQWLALRQNGEAAVCEAMTAVEQARENMATLEDEINYKLSSFDVELKTLEEDIEATVSERMAAESAQLQCTQKLENIEIEGKQTKNQLIKELESLTDSYKEKRAKAENDKDKSVAGLAIYQEAFAKADEAALAAEAAYEDALAQPQRLLDEKASFFSALEAEKEENNKRIEAARKDAEDKKIAYAEGQKQVVLSIAASVKANDLANTARLEADKAALARDVALRGVDLAEKLQPDTVSDALQMREEKVFLYQLAEKEALRLRAEADLAVINAKADAEATNQMLDIWLTAEQELEQTVAEVGAANKVLQEKMTDAELQCKKNSAAVKKSSRSLKKEAAVAVRQREQAKTELVNKEKQHNAVIKPLADLEHSFLDAQQQIKQSLAEHETQAKSQAASCREDIAMLDSQLQSLATEEKQKRQRLEEKRHTNNKESADLSAILEEKKAVLAELENEASRVQNKLKSTLNEIEQNEIEAKAYLASCREKADTDSAEVVKTEAAYSEAIEMAEKIKTTGDRALKEAEQAAEAVLSLKIKETQAAEATLSQAYQTLQESRETAAKTVREAIELSVDRLEMVNKASLKRMEKEIADLDKRSVCTENKLINLQTALTEVEANFTALAESAATLRKEEENLNVELEQKYKQTKSAKDQELASIEETIKRLADVEETARINCETIQKDFTALEAKWLKSQEVLSIAKSDFEKASEELPEKIALLEEKYRTDLKNETENYPELLGLLEAGETQLNAAQKAYIEAESGWKKQIELVSKLIEEEENARKEGFASLEKLKRKSEAELDAAKQAVIAMEKRKGKLEEAHTKAQDFANTTTAARKKAEVYLQGLLDEDKLVQADADRELVTIEQRLKELKAEEEEFVQKVKANEDALNSTDYPLSEAEKNFEDARAHLEKAEAEMAYAEDRRKKCFAKIQEVAVSGQPTDKQDEGKTDLFREADEIDLLLTKKKKASYKARKSFEICERNLNQLRQEIAETPICLEKNKEALRKATKKYHKYAKEAEKQRQAIPAKAANFITKRTSLRAEAEAEVARCVKDNEAAISKAERIFYQIRDIMEEIAQRTEAIPAIEKEGLGKVADLEALIAQNFQDTQESRSNAEALTRDLEAQMEHCRDKRDKLQKKFDQIESKYADKNKGYSLACNKLLEKCEMGKNDLDNQITIAKEKVAEAETAFAEADAMKKEKESVLENAKKDYEEKTVARLKATNDRDHFIELQNSVFLELEEEKLRVLGSKTIARIAAEEEATRTEQKSRAIQADLVKVTKQLDDLRKAREISVQKLAQIYEEGQKDIAAAKENVLFNRIKAV